MESTLLWNACERRLDQLQLPHRFGTRHLLDAAAQRRGKRILLRPLDTTHRREVPCGIRIETDSAEVLLFEKSATALHQMHILAHEISHVLCDHRGTLSLDGEAIAGLGLSPTLIRRMSARAGYTSDDEREAEMLATFIRQRIDRGQQLPPEDPHAGPERWEALFAATRHEQQARR